MLLSHKMRRELGGGRMHVCSYYVVWTSKSGLLR